MVGTPPHKSYFCYLQEHYNQLSAKNNAIEEEATKLSTNVKENLDTQYHQVKSLPNELHHHDEALKRLAVQSTLLEGIGLGVSHSQPFNRLILADDMLLASDLSCRIKDS